MTVWNKAAYAAGLLLDDRYRPGSIDARHARAGEPHVAALNAFAAEIARTMGEHVPAFDPDSGGADSRVLLLLQDPSAAAAHGSRMISRHNNDQTAGNTFAACAEAGLAYAESVHWNVIPWWAQDPAKAGPDGKPRSLAGEARRAAPFLRRTLDLLPRLDTVVLVGREAQAAWRRADRAEAGRLGKGLRVLECPHTSPLAFNALDKATGAPNKALILATLRRAAERPPGR